jgi:hypothetical protein
MAIDWDAILNAASTAYGAYQAGEAAEVQQEAAEQAAGTAQALSDKQLQAILQWAYQGRADLAPYRQAGVAGLQSAFAGPSGATPALPALATMTPEQVQAAAASYGQGGDVATPEPLRQELTTPRPMAPLVPSDPADYQAMLADFYSGDSGLQTTQPISRAGFGEGWGPSENMAGSPGAGTGLGTTAAIDAALEDAFGEVDAAEAGWGDLTGPNPMLSTNLGAVIDTTDVTGINQETFDNLSQEQKEDLVGLLGGRAPDKTPGGKIGGVAGTILGGPLGALAGTALGDMLASAAQETATEEQLNQLTGLGLFGDRSPGLSEATGQGAGDGGDWETLLSTAGAATGQGAGGGIGGGAGGVSPGFDPSTLPIEMYPDATGMFSAGAGIDPTGGAGLYRDILAQQPGLQLPDAPDLPILGLPEVPDLPTLDLPEVPDLPVAALPGVPELPRFEFAGLDESDPTYQWKLKQAQDAIDKFTASRGGYASRAAGDMLSEAQMGISADEASRQFGRAKDIYGLDYGRTVNQYGLESQRAKDLYGMGTQRATDLYGMGTQRGKDIYGAGYGKAKDLYGMGTQRATTQYGADYGRGMDLYGLGTQRAKDIYGADYGKLMDLSNLSTRLGGLQYGKALDMAKLGAGAASTAGQQATATGQGLSSVYGGLSNQLTNLGLYGGESQADYLSGLGAVPQNLMLMNMLS